MKNNLSMVETERQGIKNTLSQSRILIAFAFVLALSLASAYGKCAQDDTFISLRYAQNLWDGHGLVFNPGDRVEGITNLLWTLLSVPAFALDVDPVLYMIAMGLLSIGLLFWGTNKMGLSHH